MGVRHIHITTLLFDLGNVVFRWSFEPMFEYWAETCGKSVEFLRSTFRVDHMYEKYETGAVTTDEYAHHIERMLGVRFLPDDFKKGWNSIYVEETAGIDGLLANLEKNYRLAAFSNTNEVHYACMEEKYGHLFRRFERVFYSHIIGLRKPEKDAFEYVLAEIGIKKSDVVFFDDLAENVRGAQRIGIKAVQVKGLESITEGLRSFE
ncbi:MAG: HAD family phosphatase [Spirochaetales bacterium]|nr:HAD family phosphatase [Spirochaetales bacterium]